MTKENNLITIETTVNVSVETVWSCWTKSEHITKWHTASVDWHTTKAENDLVEGGKFLFRMEAKDGSFGFDFGGTYTKVKKNESLNYTLGDGRKVSILFEDHGSITKITESFEPESTHSLDQQKTGWQSILNNFKKYVETQF